MPDTHSILILKEINYRGVLEEYGNQYHFEGATPPSSDATWKSLFDAIVLLEKATVTSSHNFVGGYGYEPGNDHAIWRYNYVENSVTKPAGTLAIGTGIQMPGDVAVWVRWKRAEPNVDGRPVYCRKYFHAALRDSAAVDTVSANQRTALATYAAGMIAGTLPGSVKYCAPQGGDLSLPIVATWLTTRTLKRRPKRNPT